MKDVSAMEVLECFSHLIDDVADVNIFEDVFGYDVVEVSFYELEDQIHIFIIISFDGFVQFDDVGVLDLTQDFDLSVGALGISGVLEGIEDLFQGVCFFGVFFLDFPDMAVCP